MTGPEALTKDYMVIRLIGFSMISILFVCWALTQFVHLPGKTSQDAIVWIRCLLYLIAAASFATIVFLKKIFLQKNPQDNLSTLITKLKMSAIITFGICETPGIYGLVLYFIGGSRTDFYVLAVYSLVLFAIFYPRINQWEEHVASAAA